MTSAGLVVATFALGRALIAPGFAFGQDIDKNVSPATLRAAEPQTHGASASPAPAGSAATATPPTSGSSPGKPDQATPSSAADNGHHLTAQFSQVVAAEAHKMVPEEGLEPTRL